MFPWFSFLTYAVVTAVTPGPNNLMSMANGRRKGVRGGGLLPPFVAAERGGGGHISRPGLLGVI